MLEFIQKYILCYQCKNPETICKVSESKIIKCKCKSCGCRYELNNIKIK
jgi:translation initiation factor 2 beta subunit (eIF-2beta)/eIF-5